MTKANLSYDGTLTDEDALAFGRGLSGGGGGLVLAYGRHTTEEDADLIVFGSDYRTPAGHVAAQKSTQALLEGGRTAVAIAPASYRDADHEEFTRVGLLAPAGDDAALETARELAESLDAQVSRDEPRVDLLVVGSRPEAPL